MKTNKKSLQSQRQIIEKKLKAWTPLRNESIPQSGWIKAIRGALGLNTRQLADLIGVDHSTILRLEERESKKKTTLDAIDKVAHAMNCKLVYAIVPQESYSDLEAIIDERSKAVARKMLQKVDHSMRLEKQGADAKDSAKQIEHLAYELKSKMDTRIWNTETKRKRQK
jgi:predicted DNA-binding mobile mystery protein A